jgi:peptidase E
LRSTIVAGPGIEPNSIMGSPAIAPGLADCSGLGLVDEGGCRLV